MGLHIFHSSSTYDSNNTTIVKEIHHHHYHEPPKEPRLPNPDPENFKIIKYKEIEKFLILLIEYPNCTNFEGKKIIVYQDLKFVQIRNRKNLDPHFTNSTTEPSPIARFVPTDLGWRMAIRFCKDFMVHGG